MEKPLFIPLKRKFFEAFEKGTKTTEYRPFGPRWNEKTCRVGREVVLSLGYGKQRRLRGHITGFIDSVVASTTPGWIACYGPGERLVACITITLNPTA